MFCWYKVFILVITLCFKVLTNVINLVEVPITIYNMVYTRDHVLIYIIIHVYQLDTIFKFN